MVRTVRGIDCIHSPTRSIVEKVDEGPFDLRATVRVCDQIHRGVLVLENASLQHSGRGISCLLDELPGRALGEERLYAVRGAPIEIALKVFSVSETRRNGND